MGGALYPGPSCPHCERPLDLEQMVGGRQQCPSCWRGFEAVRFRPPARQHQVLEVGAAGPEEAASCAVHRRNAAVAACERCGIFMCGLCRTEADGLVICAACFDRLAGEGALHSALTRYRDYTGLAWLSGLCGLLLWFPGVVTGPAAILYAMRGLRQSTEWGDVGGRGRGIGALALGVISTIQGVVLMVSLFAGD